MEPESEPESFENFERYQDEHYEKSNKEESPDSPLDFIQTEYEDSREREQIERITNSD